MKLEFKIVEPDHVECEMTISMTLEAWKKLRCVLSNASEWMTFPMNLLREGIYKLVQKAEEKFCVAPDEEENDE